MKKISMGYQALIEKFKLNVIPHYRTSFVKLVGHTSKSVHDNQEIYEYSKHYIVQDPDDVFSQIEFALKYDGINLEILSSVIPYLETDKLTEWIKNKLTGKYTRIFWYLYETLTGKKLKISDVQKVKYVSLLNDDLYFTAKSIKSSRHCVKDNLLGDMHFCPMVRKTKKIENFIAQHLENKARIIFEKYDGKMIHRASNYLFAKETMSSFEIEHEKPSKERIAKFIHLLQQSETMDALTKEILIECQNIVVDPRFANIDYRHNQIYIGENLNQYLQKIHYIAPKFENLKILMDGLLYSLKRMLDSKCHPVVIASAISFGFVFIHPFEDGNGRVHRFLIHYILRQEGFTPPGIIFPISAIIMQDLKTYDRVLESFSKPLMRCLKSYHLDHDGILTISQETKHFYQNIDFTLFIEYLFECIEKTVNIEFVKELNYLEQYDKTKQKIKSIIDMPDNLIDLLIRCLIQNQGKLGKRKREKYFHVLTDNELAKLITIVNKNMITDLSDER